MSEVTNYRGISLMSVAVKVLLAILAARLHEGAVGGEAPRLHMNQGGFVRGGESVAQVASLYDIIRRRQRLNKRTYAVFLDWKQAYDRVPHGMLMYKLHKFGVRGRLFEAIKTLYSQSSARVRVDGTLSSPFSLGRGVRQGDPMSPMLFNIFAYDFWEKLEEKEPQAIHVRPSPVPVAGKSLHGLSFADDTALLHGTRLMIQRMIDFAVEWGKVNGMELNATKTEILVVPEPSTIANDELWAAIRARPLIVDGVEVYPSKSATYLGTKLTDTLDLAEMARARVGKGWAAFKRCERLLADSTVPLATKMLIVKGYVLPPAVYASELWGGGDTERCKPLQDLLDAAVRTIARCSRKELRDSVKAMDGGHRVSFGPLYHDLGLWTAVEYTGGAAVRAFTKYYMMTPTPQTGGRYLNWLSYLVSQDCPKHPPGNTGTGEGLAYSAREFLRWNGMLNFWDFLRERKWVGWQRPATLRWRDPRPDERHFRDVARATYRRRDMHDRYQKHVGLTRWQAAGFTPAQLRPVIRGSVRQFRYRNVQTLLVRLRCNDYAFTNRRVKLGYMDQRWQDRCPACERCFPPNTGGVGLEHILRDCVAVKPECKAFWAEWGNHTSLSRGGFIQPPPRGATDHPLRPAQRRRSYSQPNRQLFGKAARRTEYRAVRSRAQLVLSWKGITTSYSRTDGTVGFRQEVPGAVLSAFYKLFNGWQRRARGHLTPPPAASSAPPSGSGTAEPNRPDGANGAPRGETHARRGPTSTSIAQPATPRSPVRTRSTNAARRAAAG